MIATRRPGRMLHDMRHRSSILLLLIATWGMLLPACGPQGPGLQLGLRFARHQFALTPRDTPPGEPPSDIHAFRLCVQDNTGKALVCRDFADLLADGYRVGGIPAGPERIVTFQGYTVDPETRERRVRWCGRAAGVDIRDDTVTPVRMLLSPCGRFSAPPEQPAIPRAFHTATQLADGTVLLLGGFEAIADDPACTTGCTALRATGTAALYDPVTGSFTEAPGGLTHPRGFHVATALADGRVLVAGGCLLAAIRTSFTDPDRPGSPLGCLQHGLEASTAEIYNPSTGDSQVVDLPVATAFNCGLPVGQDRLLLVGGSVSGVGTRTVVEISVSPDGAVAGSPRTVLATERHAAMCLPLAADVQPPVESLVLGGAGAVSGDDPGVFAERLVATPGEAFSVTPAFVEDSPENGLPVMHAAGARLGPGRLLVCGGVLPARFQSMETPFLPEPVRDTAVCDMRTEQLIRPVATGRLATPRALHSCTALGEGGRALAAGGWSRRDPTAVFWHAPTASAEWWDDAADGFSSLWIEGDEVRLLAPRAGHSATRLADGTVLLAGGLGEASVLSSAELFNPYPVALGEGGLPALYY